MEMLILIVNALECKLLISPDRYSVITIMNFYYNRLFVAKSAFSFRNVVVALKRAVCC